MVAPTEGNQEPEPLSQPQVTAVRATAQNQTVRPRSLWVCVSFLTPKHPGAFCLDGPASFELYSVLTVGSSALEASEVDGLTDSDQQGPQRATRSALILSFFSPTSGVGAGRPGEGVGIMKPGCR